MERLKRAEGEKTAVLQYDMAEIQKDITRIDEILLFMEDIANGGTPEKPVEGEEPATLQAAAAATFSPN